MRKILDLFVKRNVQVEVVTEPVPDFSKKMVIIETPEEDEDDETSKN